MSTIAINWSPGGIGWLKAFKTRSLWQRSPLFLDEQSHKECTSFRYGCCFSLWYLNIIFNNESENVFLLFLYVCIKQNVYFQFQAKPYLFDAHGDKTLKNRYRRSSSIAVVSWKFLDQALKKGPFFWGLALVSASGFLRDYPIDEIPASPLIAFSQYARRRLEIVKTCVRW